MVIRGVVVDLDDTLYPQEELLRLAAREVAVASAGMGLDPYLMEAALVVELLSGSDRGGTIDRALVRQQLSPERFEEALPRLVEVFLSVTPEHLPWYPGAREALVRLREVLPVACLTDGNPRLQRSKIAALDAFELFDVLVITDELGGRQCRKPAPVGLSEASRLLGVPTGELLVIGDRPGKDIAVAAALGAASIRVRTGEHAEAPDVPPATLVVPDFVSAVDVALEWAQTLPVTPNIP